MIVHDPICRPHSSLQRNLKYLLIQYVLVLAGVIVVGGRARGYSVLGHEAIVDAEWEGAIKPPLLARYPRSTPEELRQAHAYLYGGCIIQDMGYYPFGSRFFSGLAHYVRAGDFVQIMLRDASNLNEYAFALGALAHYAADVRGQVLAVNPSVPLTYPKLKRKYGSSVTFEEDPKAHVLVEFSFDVVQVAGQLYPPDAYHDFIGFQVAKPLLDRAFKETYGLDIRDVLLDEDLAIGTYRRAASKLIPSMTRVAWAKKQDAIQKVTPGITRSRYVYQLKRREYNQKWGTEYKKPGVVSQLLVFLFTLIPKVGALRTLQFKPPTAQTEQLFLESFRATVHTYHALLQDEKANRLSIPDTNLDTGKPTLPGEYRMADRAYAGLVGRNADDQFKNLTPELRYSILSFYSHAHPPAGNDQREVVRWNQLMAALERMPKQAAVAYAK